MEPPKRLSRGIGLEKGSSETTSGERADVESYLCYFFAASLKLICGLASLFELSNTTASSLEDFATKMVAARRRAL